MPPVRVGVIGVGHLGYHHARLYAAMDNAELVAVVDSDEGRGGKAAEDFGVRWLPTVEALLEAGVDAASVVVPTSAHRAVAEQLLEAGIDVLVEKPIAASLDEATALVESADQHGRLLQVGHIERFNGAVVALEQAVKTPKFIECHRLSPYPNRGADVSVVLDLMIHDLEVLNALVKSDPVQIDAVGVPVFSESEDIANARIRYANGCVANVTSSRVSVERMRKIRIFEGDAYMSTDYSSQEVRVFRKKPGTLEEGASPMSMIHIDTLPVTQDEPLKRELEAFVDCVKSRETPLVSGEEGLAALRVAQEIIDAIRNA
jgi:predicted dehydrogenase